MDKVTEQLSPAVQRAMKKLEQEVEKEQEKLQDASFVQESAKRLKTSEERLLAGSKQDVEGGKASESRKVLEQREILAQEGQNPRITELAAKAFKTG